MQSLVDIVSVVLWPDQHTNNINKGLSPSLSLFIMSTILYLYIHTIMSIIIADYICSHKYTPLAQDFNAEHIVLYH